LIPVSWSESVFSVLTDKNKFEVVAATRVGTVGREKTAKATHVQQRKNGGN
jgi:hypothetical protein